MKKMFTIAIVTLALAACGGKKPKAEDTMGNTGGDMGAGSGSAMTGGDTYGGTTYGNPCGAANPCAPK